MDDGSSLGEEAASRAGPLFDHHHHHHNYHNSHLNARDQLQQQQQVENQQHYGYHHQQHSQEQQHLYDDHYDQYHPDHDHDHHHHQDHDRSPLDDYHHHHHHHRSDLRPDPQHTHNQIPTQVPLQIPLNPFATANLHALATNAAQTDSSPLDDSLDPDDFYRNYRGAQKGNDAASKVTDPMAAASNNRQTPSSMRSGGNGGTSATTPSGRNPLRPNQRSVSNPVDERFGGSLGRSATKLSGGIPPSVKDLKKRFDTQPGSTRKPPSRAPSRTREATPGNANGKLGGNGASSHSVSRSSTTRDGTHESGRTSGARGTHRQRSFAEDQLSSNAQSFASRIGRPRTAASASPQAPKPISHSSSSISSEAQSSQTAVPRQNGLLFGEILPEDNDSVTVGFGIEPIRRRRTSESNIHHTATRSQMRSMSDPDVEPPSPTDWYRAAAASNGQTEQEQPPSRLPKHHTRAQSDFAGSKLNTSRHLNTDSAVASPISPTSPTSPTSRLPILIKKLSNQNESPTSTRSNSPAMKNNMASGRTSRQHVAAARSRTPTTSSTTATSRTQTPTNAPGSARRAPPSNISTSGSGRLNAYVAIPPPKLSPSLRSSRPRQSVATATTAASRMRAVERAASPQRQAQRSAPKGDGTSTRRRKLSVGPIDFAQRRETIKLAYSKSIRESQAKEARQQAADKRKRELEVVARIKLEAEAATMAAVANANANAAAEWVPSRSNSSRIVEIKFDQEEQMPTPQEQVSEVPTTLSLSQEPREEIRPMTQAPLEPLKLEIPGSFPNGGSPQLELEEEPLSAVSASTATTEFDIDEPIEPDEPAEEEEATAAIDQALGISVPTQDQSQSQAFFESEYGAHDNSQQSHENSGSPTLHRRASYRSPFDEDEGIDDDSVSIKISLDTSAESPMSPQLTPTRPDFNSEPVSTPPAPAEESEDYVLRPYTYASGNYETTVTILGPENDFRPLHKEQPRVTIPAADVPHEHETLAASARDSIASGMSHMDNVQIEHPRLELEGLDRIEEYYVGPRLSDNVAALRDSTFTSSDPGTPLDTQPTLPDFPKPTDTSHSLMVPALLAPGNRLSQHSAWTDFSFGSDDHDADEPSSNSHRSHGLDSQDGRRLRVEPSNGDLSTCASSVEELPQSAVTSPRDRSGASIPSMLDERSLSEHHYPDNEGEPYHVEDEEREVYSEKIPVLPDHSPPPPPAAFEEFPYERDDDAVYAVRTQAGEEQGENMDEPEGLAADISPPDSTSQLTAAEALQQQPSSMSLNDTETLNESIMERPSLSMESQEEQKRLRQRQLVIRELIDTEDAFVRDMSVVEEIYKGTAEACPNLDNKTIKLIFRNTDEIIAFHAAFLAEFKEGASTVYTPKGRRSPLLVPSSANPSINSIPNSANQSAWKDSDSATLNSIASSAKPDLDDEKDRLTSIGPVFSKCIDQLKAVHEVYLRSSDLSSKRLVQIQEDKTVMLWLNECNEVAKELTSAWNLDSLLVKPMQRITKYPDIITHLLKYTPADHPDREALISARLVVIDAIDEINKSKKNYELVGQIVGNRKRKDSDVRAGLARAFGKRVDKLQATSPKTAEDEEYKKLQQQFGDDYLRLQVVLRDVEYYTRSVSAYVHEFLQYLSSMELVMRLQPSRDHAHIESKWVQFNVSMRDIEKIALEKHVSDVRKHVIEPFEQVIKCYGNPGLAMKKRAKRRLDYEKFVALKANGKKVDKQLTELVEQYEALNDTLKKELPKLSALTAKIGNICLGKFISIQTTWYLIWKEKVKAPLQDMGHVPELSEIVSTFQREFSLQEERAMGIGILNPTLRSRTSHSTTATAATDDSSSLLSRTKSRPSDLQVSRGRGLSINSDHVPVLPTPDFVRRNSGQFSLSPASSALPSALPSPANYYRDHYYGINGHSRGTSNSPITPDPNGSRSMVGLPQARPNTGRSFDSNSLPRQSTESTVLPGGLNRRDSNSTYNSGYPGPETRRLSGLFHSALPLPDDAEESQRPSRASSSNRGTEGGYNVMWLAASLFEFNIETTKHEAGYPYLTYQAGEIFDVIAEKGELWLAKNQDDPRNTVGWIWSKHFAKLADS
ncbi:hypothetical protein QBC35DRAFT_109968 [Podospora australis]|uniref:DH domain-containing protein n=1 Tax=Podospora australis TaxID=1536484 RepID=A0AAN6X618_9PEZI|nr:hypothetical protein QBC35DRAFT_109968 [Podospora australis]